MCITFDELEKVQSQMTQKPMLQADLYAQAMHTSHNREDEVYRGHEV